MLYDLTFNLTLIRHGESEVNARPDEMGQSPIVPLTEKGKNQAKLLGQYFEKNKILFDRVFSSPYLRAYNTAEIVLDNGQIYCPIITVPELREYDSGDWLGASRQSVMTDDVRHRMNVLNHSFLPPNGESMHQVERRASLWLEEKILYNKEMIELSQELQSKNDTLGIVCFSHGMTIKCLLHYVMGFDKSMTWRVNISNTSITKLHFNKYGWGVGCINNTPHLDKE